MTLDAELAEVEARQRRLVRLFTAGDMPEEMLREESQTLASRRASLEAQRATLREDSNEPLDFEALEVQLPLAVAKIQQWIEQADGERLGLLLRAIDVEVRASRSEIEISGSVPLVESSDYRDLVTIEQTSA